MVLISFWLMHAWIYKCIHLSSNHKWKLLSFASSDHQLFICFIIYCNDHIFILFQGRTHTYSSIQRSVSSYESFVNYSPSTSFILPKTFWGQRLPRLVFRIMEVTTSRYHRTNGHQPDRQPANGLVVSLVHLTDLICSELHA